MTKNKKMGNMQKAILARTLLPILVMGVILLITVIYSCGVSAKREAGHALSSVASAFTAVYDEMYPGDYVLVGEELVSLYKGEQELTGNYELPDRFKEDTGMDITLFYQNTRILTTLKDAEGNRYVATGVHAAVYSQMEETKDVLYFQVAVNGKEYYAAYLPLLNSEGNLVGMVATAMPMSEISHAAYEMIIPIVLIAVACLVVTALISVGYTGNLVGHIQEIRTFLNGMIGGELNNSMPAGVLVRKDELSDTAKSILRMQKAIRMLVERDPLTSLYNRRYGNAKVKTVQRYAKQSKTVYSICLADIDFFKKVNDTYGHEAGDIVLKEVATMLKTTMRGKGFVSRWGGEEFLMIFERSNLKQAKEVLQQFQKEIREKVIHCNERTVQITMTFGLTEGDGESDFNELLRKADEMLYYGKENGRDRIVTDAISPETSSEAIAEDIADKNMKSEQNESIEREMLAKVSKSILEAVIKVEEEQGLQ